MTLLLLPVAFGIQTEIQTQFFFEKLRKESPKIIYRLHKCKTPLTHHLNSQNFCWSENVSFHCSIESKNLYEIVPISYVQCENERKILIYIEISHASLHSHINSLNRIDTTAGKPITLTAVGKPITLSLCSSFKLYYQLSKQ